MSLLSFCEMGEYYVQFLIESYWKGFQSRERAKSCLVETKMHPLFQLLHFHFHIHSPEFFLEIHQITTARSFHSCSPKDPISNLSNNNSIYPTKSHETYSQSAKLSILRLQMHYSSPITIFPLTQPSTSALSSSETALPFPLPPPDYHHVHMRIQL